MSKKIDEYKRKSNRIIRTFKLLGIAIFTLGILISIVQYTLNKSKSNEESQSLSNGDSDYIIDLQDNSCIYKNNVDINLNINNFKEDTNYKVLIKLNGVDVIEQEIVSKESFFNIPLEDEGKKQTQIIIYKNYEEEYNKEISFYYIEPYQSQYLDRLTAKGIQVHFRVNNAYEDYEKTIDMLKKLGIFNVRADIFRNQILKKDGSVDFSYYDKWVDEITKDDINVILEFNGLEVIDTEEKVEMFTNFVKNVIKRYPKITRFEVLNEPNMSSRYVTDEKIAYYARLVKISKEIAREESNAKIIAGAVANILQDTSTAIKATNFFDKITELGTYEIADIYSQHQYDVLNQPVQNVDFERYIKNYKQTYNKYGGFIPHYVTEYGYSSFDDRTEEIQAEKLVQQTILLDKYGADYTSIYNFWNIGTDENEREHNFGLVHSDYTPKSSFYSMKNYYRNTNGSEYIGNLNIQSGLETHVYNKDGTPLIIAWSDNTNNTYDFPLNNLTAKDLYGKEITPDANGNIQITTSPVYLYNAGGNYFYQAISNVATTKYDEFTQKFAEQISKVPGLQASITKLKKSMQDISSNSTLNETTAINLMKEHYNLGTTILQAYKSGTLQVEAVKVSSMLDMLDDLGDSFEDLVTVSAKTRNSNLTETKNAITTAEKLIKDNEDLEIIYPTKILNFSQDYYDKANYINSLEEENDIKTGLIVSKNLHSVLLANWANEFTQIYIDKYISNSLAEIEYSTTDITNQSVTATLKTNGTITVTNNQNSKTHTFTENGEFTFEYTIRGQAFTKKATVTNIDKTAPVITGVKNDGFYTTNVIPIVADANLKEVKLYKNSNLVQNYATNSNISEDGTYKIVATDKAGNQTTINFDICKIPAAISYSETNLTNKNVTATLNSNYGLQITNNSGKKTYTFSSNGTFTFNYKINEQAFTITATVNNIDKKVPVITGVEEGKIYIDQTVTPKATDENLSEVKLYLNSVQVNDYKSGTKVSEEGFYKIVATDKAGNEKTVNFSIMKNNSKEYKIQGKNILNITYNTKKSDFVKKFNNSNQYQIIRNGKTLGNNDIIATGDILKTNSGDQYTLIVTGDINKDGNVNITDIIILKRYLLLRNNLDSVALLAADCNLDGKSISISDLLKLRLIVLAKGAT